jgi:PAS domain S-box-containing protein
MAGIIKALRHGEHVEQIEATQLHKDGHALEMSLTVSPVKDKAGKVIGASLIGRDITRRRRAEEALRQSEERFRVALQNAPVAVFNQDRKLRYTWVNSPTLAWAKQDCIGHTDEEIIGGKEGALLTEIKQEVLTSGRGSRTETQVTFEGEIYYFDMVVEPLRDARGNLLGITCTATDITSTKRSLLEREQLVAKLQEALDEVNMLSGMLSICASCKRITNERGEWERLESYLQTHSEAKFSHGVCPDCMRKLYPDYYPAEQENEFQR